jgi:hypothetical protein
MIFVQDSPTIVTRTLYRFVIEALNREVSLFYVTSSAKTTDEPRLDVNVLPSLQLVRWLARIFLG